MSLSVDVADGVAVVSLDRPPVNAYDVPMLRALGSTIDDLRLDEAVRAIVLTSASDRVFSTGGDVAQLAAGSSRLRAMTALVSHEVLRKLETTPLVVVAAITGHCVGGGLELALACDLRFAAAGEYALGLPEVGLGIIPGSGGTQRLARLVGLPRALDLMLTGATLTPGEAAAAGIVDRLFDTPSLCREGAIAYASRLAQGATEAIGQLKLAATLGYGAPADLGLSIERQCVGLAFRTADADEGLAAFLEKRPPTFEGR